MSREEYAGWLLGQSLQESTVSTQLGRVARIEEYYGSLDDLVAGGGYEALIGELTYSTADERLGRPNPSRLPLTGNLRTGLQSYKSAVALYRNFLSGDARQTPAASVENVAPTVSFLDDTASSEKQRLSLERDMQAALRSRIALLEEGLVIVDDGLERSVLSGRIDILCEDAEGQTVVVELKAGKADARVIGQTLGYMGDLLEEDPERRMRGIIVAHEFDQRTRSASKAVANLALFRYSISFEFTQER